AAPGGVPTPCPTRPQNATRCAQVSHVQRRYSAMDLPGPTAANEPRAGVRVLWADDDPTIRAVMAMNLEAEGFDVQTVCDGDEAYEAAVHTQPDVVVLDIMMPGRDGYAVL